MLEFTFRASQPWYDRWPVASAMHFPMAAISKGFKCIQYNPSITVLYLWKSESSGIFTDLTFKPIQYIGRDVLGMFLFCLSPPIIFFSNVLFSPPLLLVQPCEDAATSACNYNIRATMQCSALGESSSSPNFVMISPFSPSGN